MSSEAIAFSGTTGGDADARSNWSRVEVVALVLNGLIACVIVIFFHDRFWAEADDGTYAYVADQLRNGAVLNLDVHDPHGGYIHFVNAWALDVFGRDLVSLRYPLAGLTVIQSLVTFVLLRPLVGAYAIVGGLAMSSLTFVQFLNPTANWYALFLVVVLAALLAGNVQRRVAGLVAVGFTIGLVFLFRQLTGVLVAMGVVAWLLTADEGRRDGGRPVLARTVAVVMAAGLAGYGWFWVDGFAFSLFILGPLAFLAVVALRTRVDDRSVIRMSAGLAAGVALAALPIVVYHLAHGSLEEWWHDTFVSAVALTGLDFFDRTYALMFVLALRAIASLDAAAAVNGIFWLMVFLAPAVLGIAALLTVRAGLTPHPFAVLALFHAIVSAHYAIPIYAILSSGLVAAGLLTLVRPATWRFGAVTAAILFAAGVGMAFQAGQPLSRDLAGTIAGERVLLDADGLPGASIRMEAGVRDSYRELLDFIGAHAAPDDTVLGLPMMAQLNFLSARASPLRFVIAPLGLPTDEDVAETAARLLANPPAVVFFMPRDKYTTPRVAALMDRLKPQYRLCTTISGIEAYARTCRA